MESKLAEHIFDRIDEDQDYKISFNEFHQALYGKPETMNASNPILKQIKKKIMQRGKNGKEIREIIEEFDNNGDGLI